MFTCVSFVPSPSVHLSYQFERSVCCLGSSYLTGSDSQIQSNCLIPITTATPSAIFDHSTELHNSKIDHLFAFSESVICLWTAFDLPSDVYDKTARLHSVQFNGGVTTFKTPNFRHSPAFRSVPLSRYDLLCQSAALVNSAILDRSLFLSESIIPSRSSRFTRTNHFLRIDLLRFANSRGFAKFVRFQFSHHISQSTLLNSSPICHRIDFLHPSSIVRDIHGPGNCASFVVSLIPIHSVLF
jgi:hypothetical protein